MGTTADRSAFALVTLFSTIAVFGLRRTGRRIGRWDNAAFQEDVQLAWPIGSYIVFSPRTLSLEPDVNPSKAKAAGAIRTLHKPATSHRNPLTPPSEAKPPTPANTAANRPLS